MRTAEGDHLRRMGELNSGDRVLTVDAATGKARFDSVYLFGHRDHNARVENMVTLELVPSVAPSLPPNSLPYVSLLHFGDDTTMP